MSMSRKVFAGVLIAGALGAGAVPAAAALQDCPSSTECLFKHQNVEERQGYRYGGNPLESISAGNNDQVSSWSNQSTQVGAWHSDADGRGGCYQMNKGTNSSYVGWSFNDKASSWRLHNGC